MVGMAPFWSFGLALGFLLLLLLSETRGSRHFGISVPSNYIALKSHLAVQITWPEEEKTRFYVTTNETQLIDEYSRVIWVNSNDTEKSSGPDQGAIRHNDVAKRAEPNDLPSYFLSLFAGDADEPLKRIQVPGDGSQTKFQFPCGVIVHGGLHVVRFIQSKCLPIRPRFRTWAELMYHGPDQSTPSQDAMILDSLKTSRDPGHHPRSSSEKTKNQGTPGPLTPLSKFQTQWNSVQMPSLKQYKTGRRVITPLKYNTKSLLSINVHPLNRDTHYAKLNYTWFSTSRPKRMFTLTSLEGSTIPSKSNTNIRPAALHKWSWEEGPLGQHIAQRVPVEGSLYSRAVHDIRFSCEVVGPAGLYSVRIVADIPTNPIIAKSAKFPVEWAEEFTLSVPTTNIIPCLSPVPVTYTHPMCVGSQDKIRLYARVSADVASANPPTYLRYVMEKRASNKTTSFDCTYFTDEPSEFCFIYVNRAKTGAVSNVQQQCVPTFKPDVLRKDGGWGEWSRWTACSSSCGIGIMARHRLCNDPPPRNGGLFCQGPLLETSSCGDLNCSWPLQIPKSSMIPPLGESEFCQCGCYTQLERDFNLYVSTTAEDCYGVATWVFEGSPGTRVAAELSRAALLPGFQWLKIRDGNSSSSPLLLALPSSEGGPTAHLRRVPVRLTSTTPSLLVAFRSEINSSFVGSVWGFRIAIRSVTPPLAEVVLAVLAIPSTKKVAAVHITVIALALTILIATAAYGAYYCHYYRLLSNSHTAIPNSPLATPDGSPLFHERQMPLITPTGSASTLIEVLSLKSLKFGLRKCPQMSNSYTRLARKEDFKKGILRSLNSTSQIASIRYLKMRRSSSHLTKVLSRDNKQKNRRSASFDQLRTSTLSSTENETITNSLTTEDISTDREKEAYIEVDTKTDIVELERGEDTSSKYKEHRKSLLATVSLENFRQNELEPSKLSKERLNRERASVERTRREADAIKTLSSTSEISVSATEMDLEYDYYDYDVGNASAVPGSLFGMDPTIIPWVIDIEELDIKSAEELTGSNRETPTHTKDCSEVVCLASSPSPICRRKRPEEIPLQLLNIAPVTNILQQSSTSNESNDCHDEKTPTSSRCFVNNFSQGEEKPSNEVKKILNIHDGEDFQFADESEEEDII